MHTFMFMINIITGTASKIYTTACGFTAFHKEKKLTSVSNLNSPSSAFIRTVGFTERWFVWNSSPHKICGHE